jgi:hypothetical protein
MNGTGQACGTMKQQSMALVTLFRAPLKVTPLAVGHKTCRQLRAAPAADPDRVVWKKQGQRCQCSM